ncbi:glycosyltransferase family 2 protein [Bacteroides pyogenes]|uniref:glycosyltransferase family 2 protein n=1 Tax=Bacteroides pyogenes TaxID=310300 RepID=UPI001BA4D3B0|nr:glycosyltransferase family 2 protein [Bacteroides pyogenes]MBR8779304.1 hypothetical protein [Bacteroides pyogenes]
MRILAIIVSYNFERWIDRCLGSIRESEHPADVVVVDNASHDRTPELIAARYPEVRLIRSPKNLGFGKANNIGMKIALEEGYDAVFLLNQDAWVDKKTIGTLARMLRRQPAYGILSPVHLTGNGDKPDPGFAQYARIFSLEDLPEEEKITDVPFVNAAFWMIPTDVLRTVGGFSSLFYHYGEDKDYINRLSFHGYRTGYVPTVYGCHDREYREVTRQAFLRSEQVYLLSEYANINHSLGKAFGYGVLAGIKKAAEALAKGEFSNAGAFLSVSGELLLRSRAIMQVRKAVRQPSPHFIRQAELPSPCSDEGKNEESTLSNPKYKNR